MIKKGITLYCLVYGACFLAVFAACRKSPQQEGAKAEETPCQKPKEVVKPEAPQEKEFHNIPGEYYSNSTAPSQPPADFTPDHTVECFGNFNTMGVIVSIPGDIDPGSAKADCFLNINSKWEPVHRFSRIGSTDHFATSVFWLRPDSEYQVKVSIKDKNGEVVHTNYGEGKTRAEPVIPETEHELYVSPQGSDNNPGTKNKPLRTVKATVEKAKPGTSILLREGTYSEGDLDLPDTRKSQKPIVVKAFNREKVVFDCSDPSYTDSSAWNDEGNGIYSKPFNGHCGFAALKEKSTGRIIRMVRVPFLTDLENRFYHEFKPFNELGVDCAYHTSGSKIYILPQRPMEHYEILIPRFTRGFDIYKNGNLYFDGLCFRYFGKDIYNTAMFFQDTSDVLVQNCRFEYCNMFIWLKRTCNRVTVQDCYFYDRFGDWSFKMLKGAYQGYHGEIEGGAVGTDSRYSGRGLVIRRNTIDGLFDGLHLCPWRKDTAVTNETDVYSNEILNAFDDFIETDGFSRNVRIFDNFMKISLSGISLAQALDGPTFICYNVIAGQGLVPGALIDGFEGYPFKTNGGDGKDIGSGEVFFYHNTATTEEPESSAVLIKVAKWRKFTFRNNVWTGRAKGLFTYRKNISPMDWDYDNLYVKNGPAALINYHTKHETLEDLYNARGYLKHGINADPVFIAPEKGNYALSESSPNIDRGTIVPGINTQRYKGDAPDIGVYERK